MSNSSLFDSVIITDDNREAFEAMKSICEVRDEPVRMLVYGPKKSGKTTCAQARAHERDLLNPKKAGFSTAQELMLFITLGDQCAPQLERIGSIDCLFLDEFEVFFDEDREFGPELCKLLLNERDRLGLDTVIISNVNPDELDLSELEGAVDDYRRVEVKPAE